MFGFFQGIILAHDLMKFYLKFPNELFLFEGVSQVNILTCPSCQKWRQNRISQQRQAIHENFIVFWRQTPLLCAEGLLILDVLCYKGQNVDGRQYSQQRLTA